MDQQLYSFEEKVKTLNDQNLVEQVRQLFHREKRLGDAILLGLKEIKERRIYAAMGFSNLFEMLVKYYHLSETASYQRVNALKLIESVPEAQDALFNGEVSLSNAAMVQSFIQRSEKDFQTALSSKEKLELIESIKGKTHKEAQVALAELNPIAVLPSNKEKPLSKSHSQLQIVVDQETMALLKQVQELLSHAIPDGDYNSILKYMGKHMTEILLKKKGFNPKESKKNWNETIKKCDIRNTCTNTGSSTSAITCTSAGTSTNKSTTGNVNTNACKSISESEFATAVNPTSTNVLTSTSANPKVENNNFPKSSQYDSELSISTISVVAPISEYVTDDKRNKSGNHKTKINKTTDASKHSVQRSYISRNVKRFVFERAGGQCEFIGTDGHRCESHHQLEIDHVIPWSFGGRNNETNCRLLCRTHNNYRTKETHGYWYKAQGQDG
ncbi:MAG: HNH endonuclease [Bdellovibrio sp.]